MRFRRARWILASLGGLVLAGLALKFGLNRARWQREELDRLNDVRKNFTTRVEECLRVEGASPETCRRQFEIDLERMQARGFFQGVRRELKAELTLAIAKEAPRYEVRRDPSATARDALELGLLELDRKAGLEAMDELGDGALLLRSIKPEDDTEARFRAMLAARDLGELAAWRRLALLESKGDDAEHALFRGASLCLLGEREAGLSALNRAGGDAALCNGPSGAAATLTAPQSNAAMSPAAAKIASAEAHAEAGEWQLALEDARAADAEALRASPPGELKEGALPAERARTLWLLAALSIKERLAPPGDLARYEPDGKEREVSLHSGSEASILSVWRAALEREPDKLRARVRLLASPLPALEDCERMLAIAELASEKGRGVWLDALDGRSHSRPLEPVRGGARAHARCRARVARFAGDGPEALRWTGILSTLEGLVASPATLELSKRVGL